MNARLLAPALALVLVSALATACGGEPTPASPATPASSSTSAADAAAPSAKADVKPLGEAKVGDTTKCPVSGEEFVVEATSPKTEIDGKTYYFCCAGCKKKFESDPAKFGAKKG